MIQKARIASGIRTKATPYSMCRTSATLLLKNRAKCRVVQDILGHTQMTSTQIYTKLTKDDIFKMHSAHHLGEKHKAYVFVEPDMPQFSYANKPLKY